MPLAIPHASPLVPPSTTHTLEETGAADRAMRGRNPSADSGARPWSGPASGFRPLSALPTWDGIKAVNPGGRRGQSPPFPSLAELPVCVALILNENARRLGGDGFWPGKRLTDRFV